MRSNKQMLLEGPILASLLKLTMPVMVVNVLQASYQLVDSLWVGKLGGAAVAAVSVSTPVIFLSMVLGIGFAIAGSILIAQYFGAGNQKMLNHVTAQTMVMVSSVSVLLGVVGYILSPVYLKSLDVAANVYDDALGYIRISFIGLVFNFNFGVFQSVMRGVGRVIIPVFIVLGTVILNYALDPLFIFGWHFIPAMGVKGAEMATVSTQSLALFIGLAVLFKGKHDVHLHLSDFKPDPVHIKLAFRIGFPSSIEQSMRAIGMTAMTFLIVRFDTNTIAAYGAGSNPIQLSAIPAIGISLATATLVGQNIGAGNMVRAINIAKLGALLSFLLQSVLAAVAYIFAPQIIALFVPGDQPVIQIGVVFLRIACISWGFLGMQLCLLGLFRATGDTVTPMILAFVSQWILQFPIAYILSHYTTMAEKGIWLAFPASTIVTTLITLVIYVRGRWKKKQMIGKSLDLAGKVEDELGQPEWK